MAFEMAAHQPVNAESKDYAKYIQELRGAGEDGGTLWGVVVPLSLLGGGSVQLGFYNSEADASARVHDYFKMLRAERESRTEGTKQAPCSDCCDETPNPPPTPALSSSTPTSSLCWRTASAGTIISRFTRQGALHWWACQLNLSEPEMKELVRDICAAAFQT